MSLSGSTRALRVPLDAYVPAVITHEELQRLCPGERCVGVEYEANKYAAILRSGASCPEHYRGYSHTPLRILMAPGDRLTVSPHKGPGRAFLTPLVAPAVARQVAP